ncbi:acetate--CoA ligase family protein, partial [Nonomuraea sp. NPDC004297]
MTGHPYEHEVKALLAEAGVPVPRGVVVRGDDFLAARELAGPLVLKAFGPGLTHKSEAGAVALGLAYEELGPVAAGMRERLEPAGFLVEVPPTRGGWANSPTRCATVTCVPR